MSEEYIAKSQLRYYLAVGDSFPIEGAQIVYKAEIDRISPADVAPVVHGHWIYKDHIYSGQCSSCLKYSADCGDYCSHCGAKMDEKVEENKI